MLETSKIIKIPDKQEFDQLTWGEFSLMIDAFLDGDNEAFASDALSEFVSWKLRSPVLQDLQRDMFENMLAPAGEGAMPPINEAWLRALSARLRAGNYP